jgi:hypothetical protein
MKLKRNEFIETFSKVSAESSANFAEIGEEKNMAKAGSIGSMLSILSGMVVCSMLAKKLYGDNEDIDAEIELDEEGFDEAFFDVIHSPDFDELTSDGMPGVILGLIATMTVKRVKDALFKKGEDDASEESDH